MKNQISEDIKRAICKRNHYEAAKKLLDDYYYDQCGHIDAYSRDMDLKRLFPIKMVYPFHDHLCYVLGLEGVKYVILIKVKHQFLHARYHDLNEVFDELGVIIDLKK